MRASTTAPALSTGRLLMWALHRDAASFAWPWRLWLAVATLVGTPFGQSLLPILSAAKPQSTVEIEVVAFDWNCPQHLPVMFEAEQVQAALDQREARIAELEAQVRALRR